MTYTTEFRVVFFDHRGDVNEVGFRTAYEVARWAWGKDMSRVAVFKIRDGWFYRVDLPSVELGAIQSALEAP